MTDSKEKKLDPQITNLLWDTWVDDISKNLLNEKNIGFKAGQDGMSPGLDQLPSDVEQAKIFAVEWAASHSRSIHKEQFTTVLTELLNKLQTVELSPKPSVSKIGIFAKTNRPEGEEPKKDQDLSQDEQNKQTPGKPSR